MSKGGTVFQRLREWLRSNAREYERPRSVRFTIAVPYTEANERTLRKQTVGVMEEMLLIAVERQFPGLDRAGVKCVENPDWRK